MKLEDAEHRVARLRGWDNPRIVGPDAYGEYDVVATAPAGCGIPAGTTVAFCSSCDTAYPAGTVGCGRC